MENKNLTNAFYQTLKAGGKESLNNPARFTSALMDKVQGSVPNIRHLTMLLQDGLLNVFGNQSFYSASEIEASAYNAYNRICDQYNYYDRSWVWSVCESMAYAMELYYGIPKREISLPVDLQTPVPAQEKHAEAVLLEKQNNMKRWILFGMTLALIAVIAIILILMLKKEDVPKTATEQTEAATEQTAAVQPEITETAAPTLETLPSSTAAPTPTPTPARMEPTKTGNISGVYASSIHPDEYGYSYVPENAVDQDKSTAWVEGASGAGIGQSITFYLSGESRISGFQIYGGYQKNEDIYYKNCRPKEIRVTLSDGSSYDYFLEDSMTVQTVTFPYEIKSSSLTITVLSVYPGNKYEDLAISDIKMF